MLQKSHVGIGAQGADRGARRGRPAIERLAAQMDDQRKDFSAQVEAAAQQHAADAAEHQQAIEQLRYEKEVSDIALAQKQQQLEAAEAGASQGACSGRERGGGGGHRTSLSALQSWD